LLVSKEQIVFPTVVTHTRMYVYVQLSARRLVGSSCSAGTGCACIYTHTHTYLHAQHTPYHPCGRRTKPGVKLGRVASSFPPLYCTQPGSNEVYIPVKKQKKHCYKWTDSYYILHPPVRRCSLNQPITKMQFTCFWSCCLFATNLSIMLHSAHHGARNQVASDHLIRLFYAHFSPVELLHIK
jgi:hypothetical protein